MPLEDRGEMFNFSSASVKQQSPEQRFSMTAVP